MRLENDPQTGRRLQMVKDDKWWCDWCCQTFLNYKELSDHGRHKQAIAGGRCVDLPESGKSDQDVSEEYAWSPATVFNTRVAEKSNNLGGFDVRTSQRLDSALIGTSRLDSQSIATSLGDGNQKYRSVRSAKDNSVPISSGTIAASKSGAFNSGGFETFSSSKPSSSFLASGSFRNSPIYNLSSRHKSHIGFASPKSYETAQSSFASYATAPSLPRYRWQMGNLRSILPSEPSRPGSRDSLDDTSDAIDDDTGARLKHNSRFEALVWQVTLHVCEHISVPHVSSIKMTVRSGLWELWLLPALADSKFHEYSKQEVEQDGPNAYVRSGTLHASSPNDVSPLDNLMSLLEPHGLDHIDAKPLRKQLTKDIDDYVAGNVMISEANEDPVFSSEWLKHLHDRGILLDPRDALDWSGRGQHVEYKAKEEPDIPLQVKKVLGYSATAIVESVQCRRILLARKTVKCNRRLTKENVISEVEHLQRVQHSHIVRVVGTYTLRKDLSILLYPSADQNLEELMDDIVDLKPRDPQHGMYVMPAFLGCLSNALNYIHDKNVKHMDIKPKNILVRQIGPRRKVYIADFGIARSYKSAAESFTDSPTSFTRTYAAPEVVMQDTRGFAADIFSLGCVFMEMIATMASTPASDQRENLAQTRGGDYHAHIDRVLAWYLDVCRKSWLEKKMGLVEDGAAYRMRKTLALMLHRSPEERPLAADLKEATATLRCNTCDDGPEPFEAANASTAQGTDASVKRDNSY